MKITKIITVLVPVLICGYANAEVQNPRILVAYYSLTGKTESTAKAIAEASGGQLYKIQVDKAYPDNKKERRKVLEKEIEDNFLPPLKASNVNPENYDIIFLGTPVWANHVSQPVKSFLAKYNLDGKHVIPFATHSGGGRGQTFNDIASLCTNCIIDMDGWSSWGSGVGKKLTQWAQQQVQDMK